MNVGLRLLSYLVRKLSAIVIISLLIVLAAFTAYDVSNIYMVVNDGMNHRSTAALKRTDTSELNKYFTLKFLNSDPLLSSERYEDYIIRDYDYKLDIKRIWVWPWEDRTRVVVEEYISEASWKFAITDEMRERLVAAQVDNQVDPEEDEDEEPDDAGEQDEGEAEVSAPEPPPLVIPPPQWQNGEKYIEFRKVDGQWKIDRIIFIKPLAQENGLEFEN